LQLLEGIPNQEKSDSDFGDWLKTKYPSEQDRADYMAKHYIPGIPLSVLHFREFVAKRRKLLKAKFAALLDMPNPDKESV
jgi:hypothetical protein